MTVTVRLPWRQNQRVLPFPVIPVFRPHDSGINVEAWASPENLELNSTSPGPYRGPLIWSGNHRARSGNAMINPITTAMQAMNGNTPMYTSLMVPV